MQISIGSRDRHKCGCEYQVVMIPTLWLSTSSQLHVSPSQDALSKVEGFISFALTNGSIARPMSDNLRYSDPKWRSSTQAKLILFVGAIAD